MSYEFEKEQSKRDAQWRWHLVAENGKIVGDGSEGYTTEAHVDRAIAAIEEDFQQKLIASGEFLVLRTEHWIAIKEHVANSNVFEQHHVIELVEEASLT